MFRIKAELFLNEEFNNISNETLFKETYNFLKKEGVDRIKIKNNEKLFLENDFFAIRPGLNWNIWVGIDSGEIQIKFDELKNRKKIIYSVSFSRMFWTLLIISVIGGLVTTKIYGIGAIIGIGLFLLNIPIVYIRHKTHIIDIASQLDRLLTI